MRLDGTATLNIAADATTEGAETPASRWTIGAAQVSAPIADASQPVVLLVPTLCQLSVGVASVDRGKTDVVHACTNAPGPRCSTVAFTLGGSGITSGDAVWRPAQQSGFFALDAGGVGTSRVHRGRCTATEGSEDAAHDALSGGVAQASVALNDNQLAAAAGRAGCTGHRRCDEQQPRRTATATPAEARLTLLQLVAADPLNRGRGGAGAACRSPT